ncbi:GumC family protein [Fusibacter sp. JL216-2]|uniref:GumC family protein n=1 Tax=Fusibacter sp. JL216-2 TaxID=3071453 RepID=UPI003D325925
MTNEQAYYEDAISLKELIMILLKGKKIIALVTAMSIALAALISFYILDPTYESNTILLVSNASATPVSVDGSGTGVENLVNTLSANIPQTITTYKEQMLTTDMMTRVIEKLKIGEKYTPVGLKSIITVKNIEDTNLLNVSVTSGDPDLSASIANTLAEEYTDFIAQMNSQRLSKSSEFLKEKVDEEKEKLDAALEVYKDFLAQSPGTSEIQAEIASKSSRLNALKSELDALLTNYERDKLSVDNSIKLKKNELENVQTLLNDSEQFIVQKQSVLQDNTATALVNSTGTSSSEALDIVLENETINDNYMELQRLLNRAKVDLQSLEQNKQNLKITFDATKTLIESEIKSLSQSLESLKVEYAEKSNAEKLIQKDVQRAESSYDQFVKSYEETRVAESADIGKSTILINSKAVANESPVGPRRALNMAIAAILGLMVSVFYVFFKHYWNEGK